MGIGKRFMVQDGDRLVVLRAIRRYIETLLRVSYPDYHPSYEEWVEAQAAYRVAEALAQPKRGFRAHTIKGYQFYFDADKQTPIKDLNAWIEELKAKVVSLAPPSQS